MMRSILAMAVLGIGATCASGVHAELYRYVDDRGVTVLDRQGVPPEFVGKGYEVLNEQGRVLKVVPPAPTAEERAKRQARALQTTADRRLLRLYASVGDVDRARTRKLAELDGLIGVANGNLQSLRLQESTLLAQAAEYERTGREVPANIVSQLKSISEEQAHLAKEIERHQQAREQAEKNFEADRARVETLLHGR